MGIPLGKRGMGMGLRHRRRFRPIGVGDDGERGLSHAFSATRSYFEGFGTSGPGPTNTGYTTLASSEGEKGYSTPAKPFDAARGEGNPQPHGEPSSP